jgi:hypothetical protein
MFCGDRSASAQACTTCQHRACGAISMLAYAVRSALCRICLETGVHPRIPCSENALHSSALQQAVSAVNAVNRQQCPAASPAASCVSCQCSQSTIVGSNANQVKAFHYHSTLTFFIAGYVTLAHSHFEYHPRLIVHGVCLHCHVCSLYTPCLHMAQGSVATHSTCAPDSSTMGNRLPCICNLCKLPPTYAQNAWSGIWLSLLYETSST